ncbi:hypothetical protein [Deinococcus sp.]|uniref:hypothetical protein n=1 Tax=Deinococcus sp. TaxID=47478 RepID=UPI003B5BF06B
MLDHQFGAVPAYPGQFDRANLLSRICVRPPYFALQNLHADDGTFWATATAEQPVTSETGPMQASEISRHGAICGLCTVALSFTDDERRYYLAQDAKYQGFANAAPYGSVVSFEARLLEKNKRQATAEIIVTSSGHALAHLRVTYTILQEASFKRLFRSRYSPTFSDFQWNRMPDPPAGEFSVSNETSIMTLKTVPEEACAGHFEHYPAMPVAVLMGQLGLVASREYDQPYRVESATMTASDFCWAGECVRFEVTPSSERGMYQCMALASDKIVSEMTLRLV